MREPARQLASVTGAGAGSVTTTGMAMKRPDNGMQFVLDLTAAATDAGDTLDAKVQTKLGENWLDVCVFTQCLGNGGAKRHVAKIMTQTAQAMFEVGSALAAGSVRNLFGDEWRVVYTIVDADADGAFSFTVTAIPF